MIDFVGFDLIDVRGRFLAGLSFQLEPAASLLLSIQSEKDDVGAMTWVFGDLVQFRTSSMNVGEDTKLVIQSFEYSVKNNVFEGTFSCLGSEGQPGIDIQVTCRKVTMEEPSIDE